MKLFRSAVVAVASAALVFTAAVPAHAASPFWRVALTRHYGPAANFSAFSAVVVPGVHDAWVPGTNDTMATSETPVAEHWNGRTWLAGSMPRGVTGGIIDASAVSSKSIWALNSHDLPHAVAPANGGPEAVYRAGRGSASPGLLISREQRFLW